MHAISSITNSNYNPYQYLSQVASQSSNPSALAGSTSQASGASSSATSTTASFQNQLATAINNALQGVEQSGSTSNASSAIQVRWTRSSKITASPRQRSSSQPQDRLRGRTIITIMAAVQGRAAAPTPRNNLPLRTFQAVR